MKLPEDFHEQNRRSWNAATRAHNLRKGDQVAFLRQGGTTLFPEELELLGPLAGRRLLHLLCNSGQDSLCLAREGARVTGVDISDEAIAFARDLAAATGLEASFHRAEVYDFLASAAAQGRQFEIAFASYGALPWISDLGLWARGLGAVLVPGGRLVLMEFHPLAYALDEEWKVTFPSLGGAPLVEVGGVGDYVAESGEGLLAVESGEKLHPFENPHHSVEFSWGLGDVASSIVDEGFRLQRLREYPYVNGWKALPDLLPRPGRRFEAPPTRPPLPLMFGLVALWPGT